jgi:hypothetical protein
MGGGDNVGLVQMRLSGAAVLRSLGGDISGEASSGGGSSATAEIRAARLNHLEKSGYALPWQWIPHLGITNQSSRAASRRAACEDTGGPIERT